MSPPRGRTTARMLVPMVIVLLAWCLRLCRLEAVPPGWRDDELIEIHALAGEVLAGHFPIYFTGASGHEPLYHYLHAGAHLLLGYNVLSGHSVSVVFGVLAVVLTYALARRLFGWEAAVLASLMSAVSFWSLMYSRVGIRHISALALGLLVLYLFWRLIERPRAPLYAYLALGATLGLALHTYFASRLLPAILTAMLVYLAAFHRTALTRHWRGMVLALALAGLLVAPMAVAIFRAGGTEARVSELAGPLRELWAGDARPLLEGVVTTLGMFHATGDPEWLYNIPNRPVFNLLGGALLWAGVILCICRWRQLPYALLGTWLAVGLSPSVISTPAASLGHTILAQPAVYILPAIVLTEAGQRVSRLKARNTRLRLPLRSAALTLCVIGAAGFLLSNSYRDLRDYFVIWPRQDMVRFLYRADYRDVACYLDARPELRDVAVGSTLLGPWDRLALQVDTRRDDVAIRLFDPERALVWPSEAASSTVVLTSFPRPAPPLEGLLGGEGEYVSSNVTLRRLSALDNPLSMFGGGQTTLLSPHAQFANGLELVALGWASDPPLSPGQQTLLFTLWRVSGPLELPPTPIVANPPPAGVYAGPRLAVFVHIVSADGVVVAGDDGLWVDPLTLEEGDHFVQVHRLTIPSHGSPDSYALEIGLYDPLTGMRWSVGSSSEGNVENRIVVPLVSGSS